MFRILHKPTGRYFGHPDGSISSSIQAIKNTYIIVSMKELKLGTSKGRGKIWTFKTYAEKTLKELQEITKPEDWELLENK